MLSVVWTLVALEPPRVRRVCPRCDVERAFVSSDRFRVNAQKNLLDVWLVYRCAHCDFTWNLEVLARRTPAEVGAARLRAFHENERDAAWGCAFDRVLLARAGVRADAEVAHRVERPPFAAGPLEIRLVVPRPLGVRLDRLLACELAVARGRVPDVVVEPAGAALRREARDGQRIVVRG